MGHMKSIAISGTDSANREVPDNHTAKGLLRDVMRRPHRLFENVRYSGGSSGVASSNSTCVLEQERMVGMNRSFGIGSMRGMFNQCPVHEYQSLGKDIPLVLRF